MQTRLADFIRETADGTEAQAILGKCVHCGFCTATCPTYQLLGDELDGPRGRIYLIKQVLEGVEPTAKTQLHLDRCLTCRACETTCPSGVQYGRLLDIGRKLVDEKVPRPASARLVRGVLKRGLTSRLFAPLMRFGQSLRPLLPGALKSSIPRRHSAGSWPSRTHARKMILLAGCVQPSMSPNINAATARVFDALGIELLTPKAAGCCGAIRHHLSDQSGGLEDARRNIDAWWPHVEAGAEGIIMNASGCGAMVKEYGHLLRHDAAYAARAARISELTRDLAELLPEHAATLKDKLCTTTRQRVVFHPPCTLQHAQKLRGAVEAMLSSLGAEVMPFAEAHLCCGSAGTYSVLQRELAQQLRDRKLRALMEPKPDVILSANIGCISHLAGAAKVPVRHWIEWLDERLAGTSDGMRQRGTETADRRDPCLSVSFITTSPCANCGPMPLGAMCVSRLSLRTGFVSCFVIGRWVAGQCSLRASMADPKNAVSAAITRAQDELVAALSEIERISSFGPDSVVYAAHALNNYLCVTGAAVELISKRLSDHPDPQIREWLDGLAHATDLMANLVSQMMTGSVAAETRLRFESIDLALCIERFCDFYRRAAQQKQIELLLESAADVPPVRSDRVAMAVRARQSREQRDQVLEARHARVVATAPRERRRRVRGARRRPGAEQQRPGPVVSAGSASDAAAHRR